MRYFLFCLAAIFAATSARGENPPCWENLTPKDAIEHLDSFFPGLIFVPSGPGLMLATETEHSAAFKDLPLRFGDVVISVDGCAVTESTLIRPGRIHRLLLTLFLSGNPARNINPQIIVLRGFRKIQISGESLQNVSELPDSSFEKTLLSLPSSPSITGKWRSEIPGLRTFEISATSRGRYSLTEETLSGERKVLGSYRFICSSPSSLDCVGFDADNLPRILLQIDENGITLRNAGNPGSTVYLNRPEKKEP